MTRRPFKAYVWKGHYGLWYCDTLTHFGKAVHHAAFPFRTQPAALDHALVAVGLTSDTDEKEKS